MAKHQLKINSIYCGDNLEILKEVPDESVDLVYIDPPFNSGRNYEVFWGDIQERRAFEDRFGDVEAYISYMRPRILELYRVLKSTGSFYYHCDWHSSHYIKQMLDQVFHPNNFQNEIIWRRSNSHNDGQKFGVITDSIFFYTKSSNYTFNKVFISRTEEETKEEYSKIDENTGRRYKSVSMNAPGQGESKIFGDRGLLTPPKGTHWRWSQERIDKALAEEKIFFTKNGVPRYKQFADEVEGKPVQNLWLEFRAISSHSKERLGYPTQKPIELLERIISARIVRT